MVWSLLKSKVDYQFKIKLALGSYIHDMHVLLQSFRGKIVEFRYVVWQITNLSNNDSLKLLSSTTYKLSRYLNMCKKWSRTV